MRFTRLLTLVALVVGAFVVSPPPARAAGTDFSGYYYWSGGVVFSRMKQEMASPLVDGLSVVKKWKDVETSDGQYDWRIFDSWFAAAKDLNKPLILRSYVGVSGDSPQWLYSSHAGEAGATKFQTSGGKYLPHFWHPTFQRDLRQFVNAMGNRYGSYSKLSIVIFGPWDPFAEPFLPCSNSDQDRWVRDYRAFTHNNSANFAAVQQAYENFELNYLLPTFHDAFPTKPLQHATGQMLCETQQHESLGRIYNAGRARYGGFSNGANGNSGFWPQNNGFKSPPYPVATWLSQNYNPVNGSRSRGAIGYQPIGCARTFCDNGKVMSTDDFVRTIKLAGDLHGSYLEIHGQILAAASNPNAFTGQKKNDAQKIRNALLDNRSRLPRTNQ
jgi:hypothetical protein